jgi:hypothetical protein
LFRDLVTADLLPHEKIYTKLASGGCGPGEVNLNKNPYLHFDAKM